MKHINETKFVALLIAAILTFILLSIITGCKKQIVAGETIYKEVRVVEHDTFVSIEADSASVRALLSCDSAYNVVIDELSVANGERIKAESKLSQKPNKQAEFVCDCKEDSLMREIAWRDSFINSMHERTIVVEKERERSTYDKVTARGFWLLLIIGALVLLIRAYLYFRFW